MMKQELTANTLYIDQPRGRTSNCGTARTSVRRASALGAVAYWPGWVLALRRDAPVHRTATLAVLAIASLLMSA